MSRLDILPSDSPAKSEEARPKPKQIRRIETEARMERLWLQNPERFDSEGSIRQRERCQRSIEFIKAQIPLPGKQCVDLGCGTGTVSRQLKALGCITHGVDVASNALKKLQQASPTLDGVSKECLPHTSLPDDHYDIVLCLDVIADLPSEDHRLLMAELSRLMKPEGTVFCSTPLDIDTEDPLEAFASLAETEFTIKEWGISYHQLHIRLERFLATPKNYWQGIDAKEHRSKMGKAWFWMNSRQPLATFWRIVDWVSAPLQHFVRQSRRLLTSLESITRFLWGQAGASHAIFSGVRRPLYVKEGQHAVAPIESKQKRTVWE